MKIKQYVAIFTGLLGFCLSFPATAHAAAPAKPNVIFVIFDDLNDWVTGLGDNDQARTPNLQRLMKKGVTFVNCQCNAPICAPSRPSMLTGLYPHTAHFYGGDEEEVKENWNDAPVYKDAKTWLQTFKENGYDVYTTGKIFHQQQIRWSDVTDRNGVRQYGAAQDYGPYPTDGSENPKFKGKLQIVRYPGQEYRSQHGFYASLKDLPKFPQGEPVKGTGGKKIGVPGWIVGGEVFRYASDDDRDQTPDERSAAYAVEQINKPGRTAPFLINVGFHRPHLPLTAPQKYFDMFPEASVKLAINKPGDLDDCSQMLVYSKPGGARIGGFTKYDEIVKHDMLAGFTRAYLACTTFSDVQLGVILDALEKSPEAANTYIIATSDHGFHLGEKGYFFKNTLWERSTHIPLIIAGPGIGPDQRVKRPVSLVDIYPTLMEVTDLPREPHPHQKLDGHSLVPLLKDPVNGNWGGPSVALTVMLNPSTAERKKPKAVQNEPAEQPYAVRSERYRYILCPNGEEELYDHQTDPNEWTNLAKDPAQAAVKKQLRDEMEKLVGTHLGEAIK